jgi:hypothetical protein
VHASASALGGRGGDFSIFFGLGSGSNGRGGDADALARAQGLGEVVALAEATGGGSGALRRDFPGLSGNARARAIGIGASGSATAHVLSTGELSGLQLTAKASVHSEANVETMIDASGAFQKRPLGLRDAFAIASQAPGDAAVEAAIADHAQVAAAFADDEIGVVLNLAQIGFKGRQETDGDAATHRAELEIIPNVFEVSVLQDVMIGFMNPEFFGSGFDSLRFRASNRDETLINVSFDELDEALVYFDDRVLDLGGFGAGCTEPIPGLPSFCLLSSLELIFDWTSDEQGAGFGLDLIVGLTPVPEPSSVLLVALGLAVLAARARRRRALI